MFEKVCIEGITDIECYPQYRENMHVKQVLEDDMLCLPSKKPNIESLNEVYVSICVKGYKIINTILGPKLIINGIKKVKIVYTSDNSVQSVHSSHWEIPFCEFILLDKLNLDSRLIKVADIFIGVEDIIIKYFNCRVIDISILFVIIPILMDCSKQKNIYSNNSNNEYLTNKYYHPLNNCDNSPKPPHKYTTICNMNEYNGDNDSYDFEYNNPKYSRNSKNQTKPYRNKFKKSGFKKKKR